MSITIEKVIGLNIVKQRKGGKWCSVCTGATTIGGYKMGVTLNGRHNTEAQANTCLAALREANDE